MFKYCLLFLLIATALEGQTQMAVSVDKMNVLYLGIKNPITVVASDIPPERLIVKAKHGSITREKNHRYVYEHCERVWGYETIMVSDSLHPEIVDSFYFSIRRIPEPEFRIFFPSGNSTGGIGSELESFLHANILLDSFVVVYFPLDGDPVQKINVGFRFSDEVTALIKLCTPGDRLAFHDLSYPWLCKEKKVSYHSFFYKMLENGSFERIKFEYYTPPPQH